MKAKYDIWTWIITILALPIFIIHNIFKRLFDKNWKPYPDDPHDPSGTPYEL